MSRYSAQIRTIIDNLTLDKAGLPFLERLEIAKPLLFNFQFPIFDENYRGEFETKFLKHFLFNEICCETLMMWQLMLNEKLNLIMPYYNRLYLAIENQTDYFNTVDLTENFNENKNEMGNGKTTGNTDTNNTVDETGKVLLSDLPQANFNGLDYGTNLTESEGNTKSTGTQNTTSTTNNEVNTDRDYTKTTKGLSPGKSKANLLAEYRKAIYNTDLLVFNDCRDLFMQIY